ncbi:unnamed protein product [Anisakis simplex]|uniref:BACK domain-containing protein n=1 Tax=Anisakis simplex TaxID=6269 RepID=A0A0M3K9W4_ANISI|nr:unnamed protein product [Anisakis simplex]
MKIAKVKKRRNKSPSRDYQCDLNDFLNYVDGVILEGVLNESSMNADIDVELGICHAVNYWIQKCPTHFDASCKPLVEHIRRLALKDQLPSTSLPDFSTMYLISSIRCFWIAIFLRFFYCFYFATLLLLF